MTNFIPSVFADSILGNLRRQSYVHALMDERTEYEKAVDRRRYRAKAADSERAKAELWDAIKLALRKTPNANRHGFTYVAVRELVAAHAPVFESWGAVDEAKCDGCYGDVDYGQPDWPCATIITIAESAHLNPIVDRIVA